MGWRVKRRTQQQAMNWLAASLRILKKKDKEQSFITPMAYPLTGDVKMFYDLDPVLTVGPNADAPAFVPRPVEKTEEKKEEAALAEEKMETVEKKEMKEIVEKKEKKH